MSLDIALTALSWAWRVCKLPGSLLRLAAALALDLGFARLELSGDSASSLRLVAELGTGAGSKTTGALPSGLEVLLELPPIVLGAAMSGTLGAGPAPQLGEVEQQLEVEVQPAHVDALASMYGQ